MPDLGSKDFQLGLIVGAAGVILLYVLAVLAMRVTGPFIVARAAGVDLSIVQLVGMHLRKVPPMLIVAALILDRKAGGSLSVLDLESEYMAGGGRMIDAEALVKAAATRRAKGAGATRGAG